MDRLGPRADRLRERAHPQPRAAVPGPARALRPRRRCRAGCGAAARCSSTGATRHPCCRSSCHPLLRWRMARATTRGAGVVSVAMKTHPSCSTQLLEAVRERGPVTLGRARAPRRRHQAGQGRARRTCGTGAPAKKAVEWLFWRGEVSAVRNPPTFEPALRAPGAGDPGRRSSPRPPRRDDDAMKALLLLGGAQPRRRHGHGAWPTTTGSTCPKSRPPHRRAGGGGTAIPVEGTRAGIARPTSTPTRGCTRDG